MPDLHTVLSTLRRPRLLVRAARIGLSDYNRKRDLARLTGQSPRNKTSIIIENLIAQEEHLEDSRRTGDASYRPAQHVEMLVALMAECRLLPRQVVSR